MQKSWVLVNMRLCTTVSAVCCIKPCDHFYYTCVICSNLQNAADYTYKQHKAVLFTVKSINHKYPLKEQSYAVPPPLHYPKICTWYRIIVLYSTTKPQIFVIYFGDSSLYSNSVVSINKGPNMINIFSVITQGLNCDLQKYTLWNFWSQRVSSWAWILNHNDSYKIKE